MECATYFYWIGSNHKNKLFMFVILLFTTWKKIEKRTLRMFPWILHG